MARPYDPTARPFRPAIAFTTVVVLIVLAFVGRWLGSASFP